MIEAKVKNLDPKNRGGSKDKQHPSQANQRISHHGALEGSKPPFAQLGTVGPHDHQAGEDQLDQRSQGHTTQRVHHSKIR